MADIGKAILAGVLKIESIIKGAFYFPEARFNVENGYQTIAVSVLVAGITFGRYEVFSFVVDIDITKSISEPHP